MELNKTLAIALHRAMWTDMQTELGDNPSESQRLEFKEAWIKKYFPNECVMHNCFLCEYAFKNTNICSCVACPISWPAGHCSGNPVNNFSYCTAPIGDILALPEKGKYIADETAAAYREELLSKASGIPGSASIDDHIKAIQKKAVEEHFEKAADVIDDFLYRCEKYPDTPINAQLKKRLCAIQEKAVRQSKLSEIYGDTKMELAKISGLPAADATTKHIEAIQKKQADAVVNALTLYQSALSYESKLPLNAPINDHIKAIQKKARDEGYNTAKEYIAECSGVDQNELLFDHVRAIKEKAVEEYFENTPGAKLATMDVDEAFKQYAKEQMEPLKKKIEYLDERYIAAKDSLSLESGLDRDRPVDAHIREIVKVSKEIGAAEERDRIQEKIYEVLFS